MKVLMAKERCGWLCWRVDHRFCWVVKADLNFERWLSGLNRGACALRFKWSCRVIGVEATALLSFYWSSSAPTLESGKMPPSQAALRSIAWRCKWLKFSADKRPLQTNHMSFTQPVSGSHTTEIGLSKQLNSLQSVIGAAQSDGFFAKSFSFNKKWMWIATSES